MDFLQTVGSATIVAWLSVSEASKLVALGGYLCRTGGLE